MRLQLAPLLANNDHAYYPLRFLASSFFVTYWDEFILTSLTKEQIDTVQNAARHCVNYSMQGEDIYWNISFEERIAYSVWQEFDRMLGDLPVAVLQRVQSLCIQLAASKRDIDSADFLLNLISRLRLDASFRRSIEYSDHDASVLDAAYEVIEDELIDIMEIRHDWMQSSDEWDVKLRLQTPDLPESIWVIFSGAYEAKTNLPRVQENIQILLPNDIDYRTFVDRLKNAFEKALPAGSDIFFPIFPPPTQNS